ncbi:MAG: cytidine/deoxycytidylate deaminase family protein [Patescibacteria group bacterium]|jgi:dCMP deaminase
MSINNQHRPDWDDYFMAITRIIATRSTCDRLHAGAILVKDNRIISTGYNGSPQGLAHCDDVGHLIEEGHCVRTIHGEHNAILQIAIAGGPSTIGSTMYAKYNPCIHCAKYVVSAGIKRVVIGQLYRGEAAVEYLKKAGIIVDNYRANPDWNTTIREMFSDQIETIDAPEGKVNLKEIKL